MNIKTMHKLSLAAMLIVMLPTTGKTADTKNFSHAEICRATIGAEMGRDPAIIKVLKTEQGIIHVGYKRPDDGTVWNQRCRLDGEKITWATETGRWRDHPLDSTYTYSSTPTTLTIYQKYSDGSNSAKSYTRAQITKK